MKFNITGLVVFFSLLSTLSFAEDTKAITVEKEQREAMIDMHEKIVACLKTDKSIETCRNEMRQSCNTQNENSCAFMGMGSKGRMGRGMMDTNNRPNKK